jgi:transposase
MNKKVSSRSVVKDILRRIRKKYSSEEKIPIVIDGLGRSGSISNLFHREGIPAKLYYCMNKDLYEESGHH